MERIMDSLSLDALAYPTMRQRAVLVGETQTGGTCNLSSQSGLPAISIPAGFTSDGLPVGVELMGRAFTDTRLVALAFAFEQAGARRRPPSTTPALVNGRAPAATSTTTRASATGASVGGVFSYDAPMSQLRWSVHVTGARVDALSAVVLRRRGRPSAGATRETIRVIARLLGPGMHRASGVLPLNGAERLALQEGRISLAMFGGNGMQAETVVRR